MNCVIGAIWKRCSPLAELGVGGELASAKVVVIGPILRENTDSRKTTVEGLFVERSEATTEDLTQSARQERDHLGGTNTARSQERPSSGISSSW